MNITSFSFNGADVRKSRPATYMDAGFVYVVEDVPANRVKIGMSREPARRIKSVKSSAGIHGGREYISVRVKNARLLEASAHFELSGVRLHGEFFGCRFEEAVAVVSAMAALDAADDDYMCARLLEQEERGRAVADGFRRMVCGNAAVDFSDEQKSRLVHAKNFAAINNSTLGDLLAVAEWVTGGGMAVLDRSHDDGSFFSFDGLVGEVESVTVAAIYRAIAYAGQAGVVYGGGRDFIDKDRDDGLDAEFTVDRNGGICHMAGRKDK